MVARFSKESEDDALNIYVTDTLQMIARNGGMSGAGYPQKRFVDFINTKPKDNRTADEIIKDVVSSAGLVVK